MTDQIIELAIRAPKPGKDRVFEERKTLVVDALLATRGVGPERAFVAFGTIPKAESTQHVGMTRYADKAAQRRATRSVSVLRRLMGFMSVIRPKVGVFLTPDESDFDLGTFATEPDCVVEFAALVPAQGVSVEEFLARRKDFLAELDTHPEVLGSHTFVTSGGLKAKDSIVHFTVYRDRASFEALAAKLGETRAFQDFREVFRANLIAFASAA